MYGSPKSVLTTYIRYAPFYKTVSIDFIPSSETAPSAEAAARATDSDPVTLQVGSDVVLGSRDLSLSLFTHDFFQTSPFSTLPLFAFRFSEIVVDFDFDFDAGDDDD